MEHKPQMELVSEIRQAESQIPVGSRWQHYKDSTHTYIVKALVIIEADDSIGVVYEAQYGEKLSFLRPANSWLESVEWQGKTVPRFTML